MTEIIHKMTNVLYLLHLELQLRLERAIDVSESTVTYLISFSLGWSKFYAFYIVCFQVHE